MFETFATNSPAGADAVSSLDVDPSQACGAVAFDRPLTPVPAAGGIIAPDGIIKRGSAAARQRGSAAARQRGSRNCVRRSRLASSPPEPHSGRLRARLLPLLPVLALLLGALSLFAAAPAGAQVTAPSAPQNFKATPGNTSITLNWGAPSSWGTWDAWLYHLQIKGGNLDDPSYRTLAIVNVPTTSYELSRRLFENHEVPTNGETYDFRIQAYSKKPGTDGEDEGENLQSTSVTLSATAGVPAAIASSALTITPALGKLDLSWTAPSGNGSAITGYDVHYTSAAVGTVANDAAVQTRSTATAATGWLAVSRSGTTRTQAITGLAGGTAHRVRVRAKNTHGAGAWVVKSGTPTEPNRWEFSPHSYQITEGSIPARLSITLPVAAPAGGLTFTLTPLFGSDIPATTARRSCDTNAGRAVQADLATNLPSTLTVQAGKTEGRASFQAVVDAFDERDECFAVRAATAATGWAPRVGGLQYDVAHVLIFEKKPTAPTGLTVTPDHQALNLLWTAPPEAVARYDVHYTSAPTSGAGAVGNNAAVQTGAASAGWVAVRRVGTTASQEIASLTNGTNYRVRVRARNRAGESAWTYGTGTPKAGLPTAPTGLGVTAGSAKLDLAWTAPPATVTGYDVHYTSAAVSTAANDAAVQTGAASAGWVAVSRSGATASQSITGLTNSTTYRLRVRAKNTIGDSGWIYGKGIPGAPSTSAPAAPAGLGVTPGDTKLSVSWTAAGDATGYDVHYTSAAVGTVANGAAVQTVSAAAGWYAVSRSGATASQTISSLTNGLAYRVRVRAKNSNGSSAWAHGAGTPAETPTMGFYFTNYTEMTETGARATETVKVWLSAALTVPTTVSITVDTTRPASGRAVENDDFRLSTKTLSFPAGTTQRTFTITAVADATAEGHENLWLGLEAPAAAPYQVRRFDLNQRESLFDDLNVLMFDTSLPAGLEFDGGATDSVKEGDALDVVLFLGSPAPTGGTTVTLSVANTGTATETTDFTLSTKSVTIAAGQQSASLKLNTVDDALDDNAETVVLNAASTNPVYTATQTITIIDNDPSAPMSAPAGLAAAAGPGTLTVTWNAVPAAQSTAYPDYTAVLTWRKKSTAPNGPMTGRHSVTEAERNARSVQVTGLSAETWQVFLSFSYWALPDPVADPDGFPDLVMTSLSKAEGTPSAAPPSVPRNFRGIPGDTKITVLWDPPTSWGGGTPVGYLIEYYCRECPGFWAQLGAVEVSATSKVYTPRLVQNFETDIAKNGIASRFRIRAETLKPGADPDTRFDTDFLKSPFSAEVSVTPMAGLPDGPTSIALSIDDADKRLAEDAGTATVTATLNAAGATATDVALSIGSASTATEGASADFTLSPKTVRIAAGATTGTATLTIKDDTSAESDEVVVIKAASDPLAGATLNVTIVDNDAAIGAPTALTATPGDGTLALTWTAPTTGTATGYDVEYKLESAASWSAVNRGTESSPPATSQTVSGLTNNSDYDVRVRATLSGGRSLWTTAGGTPSALNALATPTNFALIAGDGKIAARWQDVISADHYVLWYGVAGTGTTEKVELGDVTTHTVSGLVNNSEYTMTVQARDSTGTRGPSAQAAWLRATPIASASADAGLLSVSAESATSAGGTYTTLALTAADDGSYSASVAPTITHVKVTPTTSHPDASVKIGKGTTLATVASDSASAPIAVAEGANAITVRVTAGDTTTTRTYTVTITRRAAGAQLDTPGNVVYTPANAGVTVSWTAVTGANRYAVQRCPPADWNASQQRCGRELYSHATGIGATSMVVSGLTNGNVYRMRTRAEDTTDTHPDSPWTAWAQVTPALPAGTSWAATFTPVNLGGAPGCGSKSACDSALSDNSFTVGGTEFGFRHISNTSAGSIELYFTPNVNDALKALNFCSGAVSVPLSGASGGGLFIGGGYLMGWTIGTGVEVRLGSDCAVAQPPTAPRNLRVTARNAGLALAWDSPSQGIITGYHLEWKAQSAADQAATTAGDPSTGWVRYSALTSGHVGHDITGLANGSAYDVRVRATSAAGDGAWATGSGTPNVNQSSNANLSALTASTATSSGGPFTALDIGSFAAGTTAYTASVAYERTYMKLTATVAAGTATVGVRKGSSGSFTTVASGTASAAISLGVGANALTVRVTAGDRTTTRDYTVTVTRQVQAPAQATLSASPTLVKEGQSVTLTATLSRALARTVTIPVTVTRDTAEAEDLGTLTGVRIARGRTSGTARIATRQDDDINDETFTVAIDTASLPADVTAGATTSVAVTIDDDDTPTVNLWFSPRTGIEAGDTVTLTAKLSAALSSAVTIPLVAVPEDPTTSADYGAVPQIRIEAGETSGSGTLTTTADNDTEYESFRVMLDKANLPGEVGAGPRWSVRVTIKPLAIPVVWLSAPATVNEGESVTITAHLSKAVSQDVEIPVTARFGSGPAASYDIPVAANATSGTLAIATRQDDDSADDKLTVEIDEKRLTMVEPYIQRADVLDFDRRIKVTINVIDRPALTAHGGSAREGRGESVTFTVRLSYAAADSVTVGYATADAAGDWRGATPATAGADYTAGSATLTFAAGERTKTVSVAVLDDAVDEGTEHFLLRLSSPTGAYVKTGGAEAHGLITNDDHLQTMWLSRFGRATGRHITDAVGDRLAEDLSPGAHATVAGQSLDLADADDAKALADVMAGLAERFGERGGPAPNDDPFTRNEASRAWNDPTAPAAQSMTSRELLLGSAFHLATDGGGAGPDLAAWGRVAHGSFEGEHVDDDGRTGVDGEVLTGTLGADADWGKMLAGVAVSLSEGDGKFESPGVDTGDKGTIESTMTTVSPYLRFKLTERVSAWGLVGWGTGDMTIRFDDGGMAPIRTDIGMRMGAVGARGALLEQDEWGGMDLTLKTDAFVVRMDSEKAANSAEVTADASQVRLVLEGGRAFAVSETATLRPSLELGLRHDGGDAETGAGLEVGGGVAFTNTATGLSLEAKARVLAAHADSSYEEWGASATARLDPGERGRGLSFSVTPTLGTPSNSAERLWGAERPSELAPGGRFEATRGLQAEAGYGMPLFGGRLTGTPNVGLGLADGGARDWRVGWRLTPAVPGDSAFEINLDATRREAANDEDAAHGVMLTGGVRW